MMHDHARCCCALCGGAVCGLELPLFFVSFSLLLNVQLCAVVADALWHAACSPNIVLRCIGIRYGADRRVHIQADANC